MAGFAGPFLNMRIVLLRHGKPDLPPFGKLTASEMHGWIASYDAAGIVPGAAPMARAAEIAATCNAIVASDLPRAVSSAKALSVSRLVTIDPVFRESGLPHAEWKGLRLPPKVWRALFRMLWFGGYASHAESIASSRLRAKDAADKLRKLAAEHESVLLVGHGMMNGFIARELLSSGWCGPRNPGSNHWQFGIFQKDLR